MSFDWLSPPEAERVASYFLNRFGIPAEALETLRLHRRGDTIYALTAEAGQLAEGYDTVAAGIALARESESGALTPSARGLQMWGKRATRNVLPVDRETFRALAQGRSLPWAGEEGLILLTLDGEPLGMATAREGRLVGRLPVVFVRHLDLSTPGNLM